MPRYKFAAERLAYWYFRLNGFLSIENFVIHDEIRDKQRTDIDLMAMRLPHRAVALQDYQDSVDWMQDDPRFGLNVPFAAFVEVTLGPECKVNGPWTDEESNNLPRALRALGVVPESSVSDAANELYKKGRCKSNGVIIGIVAVGERPSEKLTARLPDAMQITWAEVTQFIHERFHKYSRIKRQRPQWDLDGHLLWKAFQENPHDAAEFANTLVLINGTPRREDIDDYIRKCQYLPGVTI